MRITSTQSRIIHETEILNHLHDKSALELRLTVGKGGKVTFHVPQPTGTQLHIIVLDEARSNTLNDEECFQLGALAAVTPDDPEEDTIWARYPRD
jgi:hypothetical protein